MASWEDLRSAALALPGAHEATHSGELAFKVGKKGFVHAWKGRVVMKLDRARQELLFEVRPNVFSPMATGAMRWAWVDIDALDADEAGQLVREAWRQVAPRKVSRARKDA